MQGFDHFVQIFAGDNSLVHAVTGFVRRGFKAAEVCVVIATSAHRSAIEANLRREGFDLPALLASYDYIPVDADVMLGEFLHETTLDHRKFFERAGLLLTQAASKGKPVRVFGEMVALLAARGLYSTTIELEEMCNELSRLHDFSMFCAYSLPSVSGTGSDSIAERIFALHSPHNCLPHTRIIQHTPRPTNVEYLHPPSRRTLSPSPRWSTARVASATAARRLRARRSAPRLRLVDVNASLPGSNQASAAGPILLAEDHPNDVELTLAALRKTSVKQQVVVVRDGCEVLDYLYARGMYTDRAPVAPSVVFLDIRMPRCDGLEVLAIIKQDPRLRRIPVVMLTASSFESDIQRSYELGANGYVAKPTDHAQFVRTIGTLHRFWAERNIAIEPAR